MTTHGKPAPGKECMATFETIDETNYTEYKSMPSGKWAPCGYSQETVEHLLKTAWSSYLKDVDKASKDCAAAVRRIVTKGPPQYLSDCNHPDALPLLEGDTYVEEFWFMNGDKIVSGRLPDAPEGKARQDLWDSQKETLEAMEAAEAGAGSA